MTFNGEAFQEANSSTLQRGEQLNLAER